MHSRARRGFSLAEALAVVTISAIVAAFAIARLGRTADRLAARAAASDVRAAFATAREQAITARAVVSVHLDTTRGRISVERDGFTVLLRDLALAHGIRLSATRDSASFDPRGLGRGAANLSAILTRGRAAETLFVSRLGRVR